MGRMAIVCALALCGVARADALQPDELAKKNEGGYVTGLPLFAYSTDLGFGGGARAYYYWNGDRKDPRFGETSYLYRVFLQAFASTRGTQFHWLDFDAPKVFSTPYRLRSQLILQRDTSSNYFGLGDRALRPLHFPGSTQDFAKFSDYAAAEAQVINGTTYEKYDQYDLLRPLFIASVERLVLHDRVRLLAGLGFSYARVHDYTGKSVQGATEGETRLAEDCAARLVVGCHGGRDDYVRLGISYDTRDFEPDPNRGVFVDAVVDAGTVALARDEIRELLPGVVLLEVSAERGDGIGRLRLAVAELAAAIAAERAEAPGWPAAGGLLHVDRSFTIAGAGTVVTGTVFGGAVLAGDTVAHFGAGSGDGRAPPRAVRVRSLHAQNRAVRSAQAGQRCAVALAGIEPTAGGYRIAPHYPFDTFSFRFPQIGIASAPNLLRGYIVPLAAGPLAMQVVLPAGVSQATIYQNGQALAATVSGGLASFTLAGMANQPVDWAVQW